VKTGRYENASEVVRAAIDEGGVFRRVKHGISEAKVLQLSRCAEADLRATWG